MKTLSIRQQVLNVLPLYVLMFLIEENILHAYVNVVIEAQGIESARQLSLIRDDFGSEDISSFLAFPFTWGKTTQGYDFWDQSFGKSLKYRYPFK